MVCLTIICDDMMTSSNVKHFPRNWPFVRNSPHKGQWRRALMFSLIYVWVNDWVNNRKASDLRRYRVHYDVTVMSYTTVAARAVIHVWLFLYQWSNSNIGDKTRWTLNSLRPRQNGRHFADDIFKCIFFNENVWIFIKISLKFVPRGPINNIPALVQIMAWRRPGDKPLSETMMVRSLTHICVTRPQWVKEIWYNQTLYI